MSSWNRLLLAGAIAASIPGPLFAYDYGRSIEVSSEADIYELYATGDLSEEEVERLVTMIQNPLDPNKATADELYALPGVTVDLARAIVSRRDREGRFQKVEDLEAVPGMTPSIMVQIRPFIVVRWRPPSVKVPLSGSIWARGAWTFGNGEPPYDLDDPEAASGSHRPSELGLDNLPGGYVRFRGEVLDRIQIGVAGAVGEGIDRFTFSDEYQAFYVNWARPLFELSKGYVMLDEPTWKAAIGSYGVGFGQRLVFDETRRLEPDGIYADDDIYGTTEFAAPQRLLGVAGTYRGLQIGSSTLEFTGWLSRRRYDLYQYNFVLGTRLDNDEDFQNSPIYLGDIEIYQQTLPNVYVEQLGGLHATFRIDKRNHVGITGYMSKVYKDFDFTFKSTMPADRDRFGAVGLDFSANLWKFQLDGEYALMDNLAQAFYLRSLVDIGQGELLMSFRSYGTDFDNPHSRSFAESDLRFGKRDRDETGFYLKGVYRFNPWLQVRASQDIWYRPSLEVWRMSTYGRLDINPTRRYDIGIWGSWKDKSLAHRGRGESYNSSGDSTSVIDELYGDGGSADDAGEGRGSKAQAGLNLETTAIRGLSLGAAYKRTWEDARYEYYTVDCTVDFGWLVGQDVWLKARYNPFDAAFITGRVRYLDQDVYGSTGDRLFEAYLQYGQRVKKRHEFAVRYTFTGGLAGHTLDINDYCEGIEEGSCPVETAIAETPVTPAIVPSHTLWASFETKF